MFRHGANEMGNHSQHGTGRHTKLVMQERILRFIVRGFDGFLKANGVNDGSRATNVQHFHDGVVHRIKCGKEI